MWLNKLGYKIFFILYQENDWKKWSSFIISLNTEQENNIELVQKRWKQLRDSYVKAKRKVTEYIPSGSANCSKTSKIQGFRLYNQMKFLDDIVEKSSYVLFYLLLLGLFVLYTPTCSFQCDPIE